MLMLQILLSYLVLNNEIIATETILRVLDKGLLPLEKNSVALQFYLDIENEDKVNVCKLRSRPKMCCLSDKEDIDCDIIKIYGDYNDVVKPKYRDIILYIYPSIVQYDQVGYCNFILEHRCGRKKTRREAVKIPFDTRLKSKSYCLLQYTTGQKVAPCETLDQDSLHQCLPVNCEVKYSGNRPFFDTEVNKCVKAVECLSDQKLNMPDIVYVPKSNTCRDLNSPLTIADIYAISTGLGIIKESSKSNEVKVALESNCSTISQNLMFLRDILYGKLNMNLNADFSQSCNSAIKSIMSCIIELSLSLLLFVTFVNIFAWVLRSWSSGEFKKKLQNLRNKIKSSKPKQCKKMSRVNNDVRNNLLREVIVSDLPLELRDSVVDICDQPGNEVKWKRRYRMEKRAVGSQVRFQVIDSDTSTTSDLDFEEKQKLLK